MSEGLNAAEQFVADHCGRTFLSLWGMANPIGKDAGKELCDYLVVCDPHVVIVSVKDVRLGEEVNSVNADRWHRSAVEASVKQVYGAERFLGSVSMVNDRRGRAISLPAVKDRVIHRICVAFGSQGRVGLRMGDFGKGFVHVMKETSFPTILRELDTISDLTKYLEDKRLYIEKGPKIIFPGEEHFLTLYLRGDRSFPGNADLIILEDDLWSGFVGSDQYKARVKADETSYLWDRLIESVSKDVLAGNLLFAHPPSQAEIVLRILAKEGRFDRRYLAQAMKEVFWSGRIRARMIQSLSGIVFVFAAFPHAEDRQYRLAELGARYHVARSHHKDARTVVGIASERKDGTEKGESFDLFMLDKMQWTDEDERQAAYFRDECGFFKKPQVSARHADEYPTATQALGYS